MKTALLAADTESNTTSSERNGLPDRDVPHAAANRAVRIADLLSALSDAELAELEARMLAARRVTVDED